MREKDLQQDPHIIIPLFIPELQTEHKDTDNALELC